MSDPFEEYFARRRRRNIGLLVAFTMMGAGMVALVVAQVGAAVGWWSM